MIRGMQKKNREEKKEKTARGGLERRVSLRAQPMKKEGFPERKKLKLIMNANECHDTQKRK